MSSRLFQCNNSPPLPVIVAIAIIGENICSKISATHFYVYPSFHAVNQTKQAMTQTTTVVRPIPFMLTMLKVISYPCTPLPGR